MPWKFGYTLRVYKRAYIEDIPLYGEIKASSPSMSLGQVADIEIPFVIILEQPEQANVVFGEFQGFTGSPNLKIFYAISSSHPSIFVQDLLGLNRIALGSGLLWMYSLEMAALLVWVRFYDGRTG